jgi:hypothetical protein
VGGGVMTKQLGWREVKSVLSEFSPEQLLGVLQDVYKFNAATKSFFHGRFLKDNTSTAHLDAYKKRIRSAIPLSHTRPLRMGEARKAVNEFKKANGHLDDTLELMLYYVACGNDFTLMYGDIDAPFYSSLESMFDKMTKLLIKQQDKSLTYRWLPKIEQEYNRVSMLGWGYADYLEECLEELRKAFPV